MRHRKKIYRLGRPKSARKLLLNNLATSLILHEKIKTTKAKAKALQPEIDEIINSAKNPNKVIAIRKLNSILNTEESSKKVFNELINRYSNRTSGYTSIKEIGFRVGDSAPMVYIELVK